MATNCTDYDFSQIEKHWQSFWASRKTFHARDFADKPTFYVLDMFPYPSGSGLHIGHPEGYTATDAIKRMKKAQGCEVLHPMGWDAFGLPTEQFAIKTGTHPAQTTRQNLARFKEQLETLGFCYDWDREINTTDPGYFRWTQWIFLQLFKRGLAYVEEKPVWWCPALCTVLANEEVLTTDDGPRSERGNHPVERKPLRQWVLRITAYADRLLDGLDGLDWPDSTKRLQANWIGRSEGAEVIFDLESPRNEKLKVFTTRPDTLFGATYMVLAPEHPLLKRLVTEHQREAVQNYIAAAARKSDLERTELAKSKTGVFTGSFAINPVNGARIPVWVADYVLMGYGTGAIMAVPAHDERDYEFARTYDLPVIQVIEKPHEEPHGDNGMKTGLPYPGEGIMKHSADYTGMRSADARKAITAALEKAGKGSRAVNYKLRDWLFSRQRYWGEPFPLLWVREEDYRKLEDMGSSPLKTFLPAEPVRYEGENGVLCAVPLPEDALPLTLPPVESYQPSGSGESPLAKATDWVQVRLNLETGEIIPRNQEPAAQGPWVEATRETNTMPQWAGSCWYYLRFLDPRNDRAPVGLEKERYWGSGPDLYVGGAEHAVLHLLYARFWHKVLYDEGVVSHSEPFGKLFHQGIILGEDGEKMSKSRGNIVNPDDIIADYGADALRLYLMFLGPLEAMKPWNTHGIEGISRFLRKLWREYIAPDGSRSPKIDATEDTLDLQKLLHATIKKVTEDYEALRFNTAISQMMILLNAMAKAEHVHLTTARQFLQLLAPLAPHIAEELWERTGGPPGIAEAPWPAFDPDALLASEEKIIFQVNGKVRGQATVAKGVTQDEVLEKARNDEKVASFLDGKELVKVVYVPGKILNLVVR